MATPNPACTVNSSTPPVDVSGGSTPTIALANATGALYWFLEAVGCDDLTSLAAINASLVINQVAKTATFTAPGSAGSAVIFQSTVGIGENSAQGAGRDANNVLQPTYTTTFKVDVPIGGLAVIASNEIYEESPTVGWIKEINATIRAAGGAIVSVPPWVTVTTATTLTTAQSGSKVRTDTTAGAFTLKLPASPNDACTFAIVDATGQWATHNLTLSGNGNNVVDPAGIGGAGDTPGSLTLSLKRASVSVTWDAVNSLWQVNV